MIRKGMLLSLTLALLATAAFAEAPQVVTLDGSAPLINVQVMVRAGSAHDPVGMEGLANITAEAFLEGGFGDPEAPITKEDLARLTRSWGSGARPQVLVAKEATTFSFTVPRAVLEEYVETVLTPLFASPLFLEKEVSRLVNEATTRLTGFLRYESTEMLGLEALDNYVFDGTSYAHTALGSVQGLARVTPDAVRAFYTRHYRPANVILGVGTADPEVVGAFRTAIEAVGQVDGPKAKIGQPRRAAPAPVEGRELTIIAAGQEPSTGIHLAFPIGINRTHPDFWPLYVANVYFGIHRDGHGVLYREIRQERGYNYGDYSYVEHFAMRPWYLFPPFNTPREHQYFSIWIRPVATDHAHHLLKAAVYELENLTRRGIPELDVVAAKNKAKVLYLNLAETGSRLLAARVDDAYYGMDRGYLDAYLERIDAVTPEQVNAAVRTYLQSENFKILMVTGEDNAERLAEDIRLDRNHDGKSLQDYQVVVREQEDGTKVYELPEARLSTLQRDARWSGTWLGLDPDRIRVVGVERIFETGDFAAEVKDGSAR